MTNETIQLFLNLLVVGILSNGIYLTIHPQHALDQWLKRISLQSLIINIA
jgi:hypothetical protein